MILYFLFWIMVKSSLSQKQEIKKGLYLVSTPIGNLEDITIRAINILRKSDYILCEDIRVSKILLEKYDIKSKLISNHKFNERKNISKILTLLNKDLIISLISDAGTPIISDPGNILIKECIKNNINIIPLPGPSSLTTAISVSGSSGQFYFYGFFPEKKSILEEDLKNLNNLNCSIVFFISPKKFNKIIPYLKKYFFDRNITICREMTKYFEEFIRSDIQKLDTLKLNLKGELTVVLSESNIDKKRSQNLDESDKRLIVAMINKLSIKEISNLILQKKKVSKKEIYNFCVKLKNEN